MNSYGEPHYGRKQCHQWGRESTNMSGPSCNCQPAPEVLDNPPCGCSTHHSQLYGCGYLPHDEYYDRVPDNTLCGFLQQDLQEDRTRPCDCIARPKHLSREHECGEFEDHGHRPFECSLPSESAVVPLQFAREHKDPCSCEDTSPPYSFCSPGSNRAKSSQQMTCGFGNYGDSSDYTKTNRAMQEGCSYERRDSHGGPRYGSERIPDHTPITKKVRFFEDLISEGSKGHGEVLQRTITQVCEEVEEIRYHVANPGSKDDEDKFTLSFQNQDGVTSFAVMAKDDGNTTTITSSQYQKVTNLIDRRPQEVVPLPSRLDTHALNGSGDHIGIGELLEIKYKLEGDSPTRPTNTELADGNVESSQIGKIRNEQGVGTDGSSREGCTSSLQEAIVEHVTQLCTRLDGVSFSGCSMVEIKEKRKHGLHHEKTTFNIDEKFAPQTGGVPSETALDGDGAEINTLDTSESGNSQRGGPLSRLQSGESLPVFPFELIPPTPEDDADETINECVPLDISTNSFEDEESIKKKNLQRRRQQTSKTNKTSLTSERCDNSKLNAPGKSVKRSHDDVIPNFRFEKAKEPSTNNGLSSYVYKSKMNFPAELDTDDKDIQVIYQRKGTTTERKEIEKLTHDVTELKIKLNELQFRQQTLDPVPVHKKTVKKAAAVAVKKLSPRKPSQKKRKVCTVGSRRSGSGTDESFGHVKKSPNTSDLLVAKSKTRILDNSNNTVDINADKAKTQFEISPILDKALPSKSSNISIHGQGSCTRNEQNEKRASIQPNTVKSLTVENETLMAITSTLLDESENEKKRKRDSIESVAFECTAIHEEDLTDEHLDESRSLYALGTEKPTGPDENVNFGNGAINLPEIDLAKNNNLVTLGTIPNVREKFQEGSNESTYEYIHYPVDAARDEVVDVRQAGLEDCSTLKKQLNTTPSIHVTNPSLSSSHYNVIPTCAPHTLVKSLKSAQEVSLNKTNISMHDLSEKSQFPLTDTFQVRPVDGIVQNFAVKISNPPQLTTASDRNGNGGSTKVQQQQSYKNNDQSSSIQPLPKPTNHSHIGPTPTHASQERPTDGSSVAPLVLALDTEERNILQSPSMLIHQGSQEQQLRNSSSALQGGSIGQAQPSVHQVHTDAEFNLGTVGRNQSIHCGAQERPANNTQVNHKIAIPNKVSGSDPLTYGSDTPPQPYGFVPLQTPFAQSLPSNIMQMPIKCLPNPTVMMQNQLKFSQFGQYHSQGNAPRSTVYQSTMVPPPNCVPRAIGLDGNGKPVFIFPVCNTPSPITITHYQPINAGNMIAVPNYDQQHILESQPKESQANQNTQTNTSTFRNGKPTTKLVLGKEDVNTLKYPGSIFMPCLPQTVLNHNQGCVQQDHVYYAVDTAHAFMQYMQPHSMNSPFVNSRMTGPVQTHSQPLATSAATAPNVDRRVGPPQTQSLQSSAVHVPKLNTMHSGLSQPLQSSLVNTTSYTNRHEIPSQLSNRPLQPAVNAPTVNSLPATPFQTATDQTLEALAVSAPNMISRPARRSQTATNHPLHASAVNALNMNSMSASFQTVTNQPLQVSSAVNQRNVNSMPAKPSQTATNPPLPASEVNAPNMDSMLARPSQKPKKQLLQASAVNQRNVNSMPAKPSQTATNQSLPASAVNAPNMDSMLARPSQKPKKQLLQASAVNQRNVNSMPAKPSQTATNPPLPASAVNAPNMDSMLARPSQKPNNQLLQASAVNQRNVNSMPAKPSQTTTNQSLQKTAVNLLIGNARRTVPSQAITDLLHPSVNATNAISMPAKPSQITTQPFQTTASNAPNVTKGLEGCSIDSRPSADIARSVRARHTVSSTITSTTNQPSQSARNVASNVKRREIPSKLTHQPLQSSIVNTNVRCETSSQGTNKHLPLFALNTQSVVVRQERPSQSVNQIDRSQKSGMQDVTLTQKSTNRQLLSAAVKERGVNVIRRSHSQTTSQPNTSSALNIQGMSGSGAESNQTHYKQDTYANCACSSNESSKPTKSLKTYKTKESTRRIRNSQLEEDVSKPLATALLNEKTALITSDDGYPNVEKEQPSLLTLQKMRPAYSSEISETDQPSMLPWTLQDIHSKRKDCSKVSNQQPPESLVTNKLNPNITQRPLDMRAPLSLSTETVNLNHLENDKTTKKSMPLSMIKDTDTNCLVSSKVTSKEPAELLSCFSKTPSPQPCKMAPTQLMLMTVLKERGVSMKCDGLFEPPDKETLLKSLSDNNFHANTNLCRKSFGSQLQKKPKKRGNIQKIHSTNGTKGKEETMKDEGTCVLKKRVHLDKNTTSIPKSNSKVIVSLLSHKKNAVENKQARPFTQSGEKLKSTCHKILPHTLVTSNKNAGIDSKTISHSKEIKSNGLSEKCNVSREKPYINERQPHLPDNAIPIHNPIITIKKHVPNTTVNTTLPMEKSGKVNCQTNSQCPDKVNSIQNFSERRNDDQNDYAVEVEERQDKCRGNGNGTLCDQVGKSDGNIPPSVQRKSRIDYTLTESTDSRIRPRSTSSSRSSPPICDRSWARRSRPLIYDEHDGPGDAVVKPRRSLSQDTLKKPKYQPRSCWGYWYTERRGLTKRAIEHMERICTTIWNDEDSIEFRHDVDFKRVVDYTSIVKQPLCLHDICTKVKRPSYQTVDQFIHDMRRLIFNSRLYNARNSELGKVTTSLEAKINKLLYEVFECNFYHITGDPLERDANPNLQYTLFALL